MSFVRLDLLLEVYMFIIMVLLLYWDGFFYNDESLERIELGSLEEKYVITREILCYHITCRW